MPKKSSREQEKRHLRDKIMFKDDELQTLEKKAQRIRRRRNSIQKGKHMRAISEKKKQELKRIHRRQWELHYDLNKIERRLVQIE
jgi:hypothetical protein